MFGDLIDRPRTWKYAVPGALVMLLVPVIGKMATSDNPEIQYWALAPLGLCVILGVVTLVNLWKYITEHAEAMYDMHQMALSRTPLVMLAENMKQMHPEAVKVLNRFGVRTSWQVRVNVQSGEKDWVLADTNAHFGFIEHVLSRSGRALLPKRHFSEGSKKWDPDGLVTDREQYDDLEKWLFARLIVTRSHGEFQPAEFIPPWRPQLVLDLMGLTGDQDLYHPGEEPRKDLGKTELNPVVNGNGQNGKKKEEHEVLPLTEAELEAIAKENAAYAEKYLSS